MGNQESHIPQEGNNSTESEEHIEEEFDDTINSNNENLVLNLISRVEDLELKVSKDKPKKRPEALNNKDTILVDHASAAKKKFGTNNKPVYSVPLSFNGGENTDDRDLPFLPIEMLIFKNGKNYTDGVYSLKTWGMFDTGAYMTLVSASLIPEEYRSYTKDNDFQNCKFRFGQTTDYRDIGFRILPRKEMPYEVNYVLIGQFSNIDFMKFTYRGNLHNGTKICNTINPKLFYDFRENTCYTFTAEYEKLSQFLKPNQAADGPKPEKSKVKRIITGIKGKEEEK